MKKRQVTIVDLAAAAGVSIATVSNVLNRRNVPMTPETIYKVEQAAEALGYRRNVMAASLSRRKSYEFGMLVPSFGGYYGRFAEEMQRTAHLYGYHLSVFSAAGFDPDIERRHIDVLLQRRVDGLFCHGLAMSQEATRTIVCDGTPLVLFNAWGWPMDIAAGAVNLDFIVGCGDVVRHLYEQGCRRMAYVSRPSAFATDQQRRTGFRMALDKLGERVDAEILELDAAESPDRVLDLAIERFAGGQGPIGVMAFDDPVALSFMSAVLRRGYRVPEDFKIVGFNNDPLTTSCHPMLSTMDVPYHFQADMAVLRMLEQLGETQLLQRFQTEHLRKSEIEGHELRVPMKLIARRSSEAT